jgi:hypothetical protein
LRAIRLRTAKHLPNLRLIFSIYATNYSCKFLGEGRRLLAQNDKAVFERSLKIIDPNTAAESKVLRQWALALKGFLLCAIERPGDAQTTVA